MTRIAEVRHTDKELNALWVEVDSLGGFLKQNVEKRRNMTEFYNALDRLKDIEKKFKRHQEEV